MGKEIKIGLAVIGVLLVVFGGLLFRKLAATDTPAGPPADAVAASRPLTSAGMADAREGSSSEKSSSERRTRGAGRGNKRDEAVVDAAQSDEARVVVPAGDRFASRRAAAEGEPALDDQAVHSNPFRRTKSPSAEIDQARREDLASDAPRRLPEPLHEPARLPGNRDGHPTLAKDPIRRASAEEPLGNATPPGDVGGLRDAAPPREVSEPSDAIAPREGTSPRDVDTVPDDIPEARNLADSPPSETNGGPVDPPASDPGAPSSPTVESAPIGAQSAPPAEAPREYEPRQAPGVNPWPRGGATDPSAGRVEPVVSENGKYTIQPNDTLWLISEKVYGNGRYFKAIYEHNRSRLPHPDHLTVGAEIAVPSAGVLEQTYPSLCPKQRKSALVKPRTLPASTRPRSGGNVYVVAEGDTLFDIARYELGKASRWSEIYDLNRETLGNDFDYLQPGTELIMPSKAAADSTARQTDSRYQR